MTDNTRNELLTKWLDGEITGSERAVVEEAFQADADFCAEAQSLQEMRGLLAEDSGDVLPHGDFFNSQLTRRIERESFAPVDEKPARQSWLQRLILPIAFGGMAASFLFGMMAAPNAVVPAASSVTATVYSPAGNVTAEVIDSSQGSTVIVLNGLDAIPDDIDLVASAPSDSRGDTARVSAIATIK